MTVLVKHDHGCRYARDELGGHTDLAKRFADWYNLHKTAGAPNGHWIAVSLNDGSSDGSAYPDRKTAMRFQHGNEKWFAYVQLGPATMSVCEAESVMRWQRQTHRLQERFVDKDERQGGLQVIPRLNREDLERQMAAIRSGRGAIALGYAKEVNS